MSKIHLDRLKDKYQNIPVSGDTYQNLIAEIIEKNTTRLDNKVARITKDKMTKIAGRVSTKEKALILPDLTDVIQSRTITARKSAEQSKLITDTLRDRITKDIRQTFQQYEKEGKLITQSGVTAGRLNKNVVADLEARMTKTFAGYTKRNKDLGMPTNIHTIAVTEARSSINAIKLKYAEKLNKQNPDFKVRKKWIQNKSMAENPRRGHSIVNNKVVDMEELFEVPMYQKIGNRYIKTGTDLMTAPHDKNASPSNVIGCNCDLVILISRSK